MLLIYLLQTRKHVFKRSGAQRTADARRAGLRRLEEIFSLLPAKPVCIGEGYCRRAYRGGNIRVCPAFIGSDNGNTLFSGDRKSFSSLSGQTCGKRVLQRKEEEIDRQFPSAASIQEMCIRDRPPAMRCAMRGASAISTAIRGRRRALTKRSTSGCGLTTPRCGSRKTDFRPLPFRCKSILTTIFRR